MRRVTLLCAPEFWVIGSERDWLSERDPDVGDGIRCKCERARVNTFDARYINFVDARVLWFSCLLGCCCCSPLRRYEWKKGGFAA